MLIRKTATQSARRAIRLHQSLSTSNPIITNRLFSSETDGKKILYDIVPKQNFGEYKEYSVIFTNRSLNLMSDPFQKVMRARKDIAMIEREAFRTPW